MILKVFKKAFNTYQAGCVHYEGIYGNKIRFTVTPLEDSKDGEKMVTLELTKQGIKPSCSCTHKSLQMLTLCSHIIACLISIYFKRGKIL